MREMIYIISYDRNNYLITYHLEETLVGLEQPLGKIIDYWSRSPKIVRLIEQINDTRGLFPIDHLIYKW